MTFLKKLFINDIQFLSKIEKYAFDSLEKIEFFEMKNNPILDFIDPKAFYDAKIEVYYATSYLPRIFYCKMLLFSKFEQHHVTYLKLVNLKYYYST